LVVLAVLTVAHQEGASAAHEADGARLAAAAVEMTLPRRQIADQLPAIVDHRSPFDQIGRGGQIAADSPEHPVLAVNLCRNESLALAAIITALLTLAITLIVTRLTGVNSGLTEALFNRRLAGLLAAMIMLRSRRQEIQI
jgi:hypothetical protein